MHETRAALASDRAAIDALLGRAFGRADEARLVHGLRASDALEAERVVTSEGEIIGYAAVFRMSAPDGWLGLGPVAVDPDWQRRGHGREMVREIVQDLCLHGGRMLVVLGEAGFYEGTGFSAGRAARLETPYPREHTLLAGPGEAAPEAFLAYPAAFG